MIRSQKLSLVAAVALGASGLLAGSGAGVLAQTAAPAVDGVPTVPTGYAELDKALGADQPYKGTKVGIQTQWTGVEGDNFNAVLAAFATATGITIQQDRIGTSHETLLRTRIEGGDPGLDMAVLAQPSGVVDYGQKGKIVDVRRRSSISAKLKTENSPATLGLVTDGDHIWGIPYKEDVKGVIWYPIKAFAAAGYKVPTTWDEMIKLSDQIVKDGKGNPWCIGIEQGTATGWEATDWVEEVVLRTAGLDVYNKWITGEVKFDSPEIKAAFDKVAQIFFTPNYVYGGNTAIVATSTKTAMDPMFTDDLANPGCWMQNVPAGMAQGSSPISEHRASPASTSSERTSASSRFPPSIPRGACRGLSRQPDGHPRPSRGPRGGAVPGHPVGHPEVDRGGRRPVAQPDHAAGVVRRPLRAPGRC